MNIRDTIGTVMIAAFVGALALLFWKSIPEANSDLIVYMLGQLSGFVGGVVAAHYTINAGQQKIDEKRVDNTRAAFEAVTATANAQTGAGGANLGDGEPLAVEVVNTTDKPVPTTEGEVR